MSNKQSANARFVRCPRCKKLLLEPTEVLIYACGGCSTTLQAKYYKGDDKKRISLNKPSSSRSHEINHVHSIVTSQNSSSASESPMPGKEGMYHAHEDGDLKRIPGRNSDAEASSLNECSLLDSKEALQPSPVKQGERRELDNFKSRQVDAPSSSSQASSTNEPNTTSLLVAANAVGELDHAVIKNSILDQIKTNNLITEDFCSNEPTSRNSRGSKLFESPNREGILLNSIEKSLEQLAVETSYNLATSASDPTEVRNVVLSPSAAETEEIDNMMGEIQLEGLKQQHLEGSLPTEAQSSSDSDYPEKGRSLEQARAGDRNDRNEADTESHKNDDSSFHPGTRKVHSASVASEQNSKSRSGIIRDLEWQIQNPENSMADGNVSHYSTALQSTNVTREEDRGSLSLPEAIGGAEKNSDCFQENGKVHLVRSSSPSKLERNSSDIMRDPNRKIDKPEDSGTHEFKSANSYNIALASVELFNASSRDGVSLEELSKLPTNSSFAYDDGVSSFDGCDDQVVDQNLQMDMQALMGTTEVEDGLHHGKWDESNRNGGSSRIQHQARNSHESLQNLKHLQHPRRGSIPSTYEFLEDTIEGMSRRRMRLRKEEFPSGISFNLRNAAVDYGSNNSSNYYSHVIHHPPYKHEDCKCHIDRRYIIDQQSKEKTFPEASGSFYRGVHHHRYHGKGRTAESQVHNFSHVPFSGEAMNSYYHVCGSHLSYHGSDVWPSSHLAPLFGCDRGLLVAHSSSRDPDTYDSFLESPLQFAEYDSHAAWSDDQRYHEQMRSRVKSRKKDQPVQQYIRPIAGGAPFITCYRCLELLHLPADFLPQGSSQRLKCGACSKLLKFSLQNEHHIVPYVPKGKPHLIRAVENDKSKRLTSVSTCQSNYNLSHHDVSERSCSNTGDAQVAGIQEEKEMHLHYSFVALDRQKHRLESEDFTNKGMVVEEPHDPAGASFSYSGQQKVLARSRSPLHRLMGYTSPTDVLQGLSRFRN
ncbi:hypothetical protein Dimus_022398 [Dionaea muscipula]